MTKDLRLAVNQEYFDDIKYGIKTEEYRLKNEFWTKRIEGKTFDTVTITAGYPKRGDSSRIMTFPWRGYEEKQITHKHFGGVEKTVFAIKVGE